MEKIGALVRSQIKTICLEPLAMRGHASGRSSGACTSYKPPSYDWTRKDQPHRLPVDWLEAHREFKAGLLTRTHKGQIDVVLIQEPFILGNNVCSYICYSTSQL